jgi:hypothetical protein
MVSHYVQFAWHMSHCEAEWLHIEYPSDYFWYDRLLHPYQITMIGLEYEVFASQHVFECKEWTIAPIAFLFNGVPAGSDLAELMGRESNGLPIEFIIVFR